MTVTGHTLTLPGLREDNPRDFLAALGLVRWLTSLFGGLCPCLSWAPDTGIPSLTTRGALPADWSQRILDCLLQWNSTENSPFALGKIEDIGCDHFRFILSDSASNLDLRRFLAGLAAQVGRDGFGRRSDLIIESASRSVLNGITSLLSNRRLSLDIGADLMGTGALREVQNTSRWHPAEFQSAAYVAADPQGNKHRDRVSLNLLAVFGLTFYPPVDSVTGRRTPGTRRWNGEFEYSWPVWSTPLGADEVSTLVVHPLCHQLDPDPRTLQNMGVHQLWRSRKFKPDGNNDYFSTATPAF